MVKDEKTGRESKVQWLNINPIKESLYEPIYAAHRAMLALLPQLQRQILLESIVLERVRRAPRDVGADDRGAASCKGPPNLADRPSSP